MSELEAEYRLDYFEEEGFSRKECSGCGDFFWTRDAERELCGEPPCEEYSFLDNPGFSAEYSLEEMREAFLAFFEDHGHERIDPYPVAANRWRDDVLLTQASIYDFQPLVTSGTTPPPANPLTISQPCIRMQDIDNVGKTGRHTMAFEMMAHHAFNAREDLENPEQYAYQGEVYWKDETVQYCDEFFDSMGADIDEITYIEDPWVGGGNAGPAIEVIYGGAELATLVFMSMEQDEEGDYEMKDGNRYSKMDTYIVDTGYGLERWTWVSQGTPTVYEAVYPEMISFLKENAGLSYSEAENELVHRAAKLSGNLDIDAVTNVESARENIAAQLDVETAELTDLLRPLEDVYAIADHCRTLAYMFGDGIVPSNVGTGYLVRMVLRRTKRLCDTVGIDAPLDELVDMQAERLGYTNRDTIRDMVRTEGEKYRETLDRGGRRVRQLAEEYATSNEVIPVDELLELYDSHGIQPDMVAEIAAEVGADVDVPDEFYRLVAERHAEGDEAETIDETRHDAVAKVPETERLYYDDPEGIEFEAVVLDVLERGEESADGENDSSERNNGGETYYEVVLDQTLFYPEGGGQPPDHGVLSTDDASISVSDVQIRDGVIYHRTAKDPSTGEIVRGRIDARRRHRLMRHHTATHIVVHAARQVLGEHVRQAGAQKGIERSRIDIRHYDRISRSEVKRIEAFANEIVTRNVSVTQEWPDRNAAEERYGFDLYQGGVPAGTDIRLIHVADDVQACGGTHVSRTGDIGAIKVSNTTRVQDGVERLVFAAGDAAIAATQETEDALYAAATAFGEIAPDEVPETARRFFEEWKQQGKRIEELNQQLAEARVGGSSGEEVEVGDTVAVLRRLDASIDELRATANAIVEEGKIAVLASGPGGDGEGDDSDDAGDAQFVVAVPEGVEVNAGEVVSELATRVGGGGGGPPDFAQGGGPEGENVDEVLDDAPDVLRRLSA